MAGRMGAQQKLDSAAASPDKTFTPIRILGPNSSAPLLFASRLTEFLEDGYG